MPDIYLFAGRKSGRFPVEEASKNQAIIQTQIETVN
jgi:hypothetical protein